MGFGSWKKTDATNLKMLFVVYVYFKQDSNSFHTTFIATLRFFSSTYFFMWGRNLAEEAKKNQTWFL